MTPLPGLAECFNESPPDGIKFQKGTKMAVVDHDQMNDVIRGGCSHSIDAVNNMGKEYEGTGGRTVHLKAVSFRNAGVSHVDWKKKECEDNFAIVLDNCPDYGGQTGVNGVEYRVYAYYEP
ncbi:MAG: hypothetical protein LQ343_006593 [Gyalolechia ehrenbergii]|nr:MAG: hypothetical protein LQ343_006593 [Gyalolechia ehrenbergii]